MPNIRAVVANVNSGGIADEVGIEAGDIILTVNGRTLCDLIDFSFEVADEELVIDIQKPDGEQWTVEIEKEYDEDLGIEFENAVFDSVKVCHNHCVFCFVDQMPKGLRSSLYIKDDDYRLSFLYGNFITLTNITEQDLQRIIRLHLSPLYVSVHTTQPDVRVQMMHNKKAAQVMNHIHTLLDAGIELHTQIVLCPGYNDQDVFDHTVNDLAALHPGVLSIAAVPVGLTCYRDQCRPLHPFTAEQARELIKQTEDHQRQFRERYGKTLLYLGDEFYLMAGLSVPSTQFYDEFPQLENGVGMVRLFLDDWNQHCKSIPAALTAPRRVTVVCGVSMAKVLGPLLSSLEIQGLTTELVVVNNHFFGPQITVSGLLTGHDILEALQSRELSDSIILPATALRKGQSVFLDGMSPTQIADHVGKPVLFAATAEDVINLLVK